MRIPTADEAMQVARLETLNTIYNALHHSQSGMFQFLTQPAPGQLKLQYTYSVMNDNHQYEHGTVIITISIGTEFITTE